MTREYRGRPMGEISQRILQLAATEEVWSTKAAVTLQLSRGHASQAVFDLARHGHLEEVDRRKVEGALRPVPVYRAAAPSEPVATPVQPWMMLLDWPRGF
jgi:predicted transcriptional regulator